MEDMGKAFLSARGQKPGPGSRLRRRVLQASMAPMTSKVKSVDQRAKLTDHDAGALRRQADCA